MISFRTDKEKNILFVNIIGITPKEKLAEGMAEFSQKCNELREHFTIINDMTLCKMNSEHDFELMCKLTQTLLQRFVIGKIIRIIGTNEENMKKLSLEDKKLGLKNIHYVSTRKHALEEMYKLPHSNL
ncbi:MAG: hypothetical protein PHE60_09565 [Sulfurospirillaceae bacterium]|nr:hypothetical protein [Sulfurospirillaceae bacterium]